MAAAVDSQPRWETALLQRPSMDLTEETAPEMFDSLRFAARPDLCLIFSSNRMRAEQYKQMLAALRAALPSCCTIAGCAAGGVIGTQNGEPKEIESGKGWSFSLSLIHLPPLARLVVWHQTRGAAKFYNGALCPPPMPRERTETAHCLLLSTPSAIGVEASIAGLQEACGKDTTFSGGNVASIMLSLGHGLAAAAEAEAAKTAAAAAAKPEGVVGQGALGIGFIGEGVRSAVGSVQGLERVGPLYKVLRCTAPLERGRETSPRYTVVNTVAALDSPNDPDSAGEEMEAISMITTLLRTETEYSVALGIVHVNPSTGEHEVEVMHEANVINGVRVPRPVMPGTLLGFFGMSPPQSRRDVAACAGHLASQLSREDGEGSGVINPWLGSLKPVTGAFCSICVGRGRDFYDGAQNVETAALREKLGPQTKCMGFFANGELGPAPYGEYGWRDEAAGTRPAERAYTSVFSAVRLLPTPQDQRRWCHQ